MRFKCPTKIRGCVRGNERGFTIVEMMMVMFMSAIVLIAIAVIVTGSYKYLSDGRGELRLQQDFSLISLVLSRNIAEGMYGDQEIYNSYADYIAAAPPQSSGSCLKLYFPSGDSTILYKDNSDFKIMNTDSTFTNLVPGVVDSLIFTKKTKSIQTKLSLSQGTWSLEQTLLVAFRNSSVSVGSDAFGNRRCELVIQASQVPANVSSFPLLLTAATLPSEMFDADGSYPALDGGGDIKFSSDSSGTRLACEIVTFTTDNNPANGKAEIWVRVPSVSSSSNTSIWVWYDSTGQIQPAANSTFGSEAVWDSNYKGVWHLKESASGAANEFADATRNANHGQGLAGGLGNRKCELVIQSSKVPGDLTNFPLLLTAATLPSEMFDADGPNPALDGGGDIKFSSDSTGASRLSCEIVTFTTDNNPALGKAEIWVKVPTVSSSSDTSIWVWYDLSGESQPDSNAAFGSESVWDANYKGVWHLNEATDATNIDATSNANNGTPQNSPASIAGKIDGALNFEGAAQTRVEVGTADSLDLSLYANWTISAWVKPSTNYVNSGYPIIYTYGSYRATLDIAKQEGPQDGLIEHYRNDSNGVYSNTVMNINAWNHVVVVFASDTTRFYLNGGYDGFGLSVTINQDNSGSHIGGYPGYNDGDLLGVIDEVRVSNALRTADWITADFNNQDDPSTFVIEGTPEAGTVAGPAQTTSGKIGNAQDFDGSDDYVDLGNASLGSSLDLTERLTLSAWVRSDETGDRQNNSIIGRDDAGSNRQYNMHITNDGTGGFLKAYLNGSKVYGTTDINSSGATWYHAAITWDKDVAGGEFKVYVNGTEENSSTRSTALTSYAQATEIGRNDTDYFDGQIDEARISNTARSADWITAEFNNQDTPATFVIEGTPVTP